MKSASKSGRKGLSEGMKSLGRRLAARDGDAAEASAEILSPGYFLENYYTGRKLVRPKLPAEQREIS